jgi:hypothetical protein
MRPFPRGLSAGVYLLIVYGMLALSGCQAGGNSVQSNTPQNNTGSPAPQGKAALQCTLQASPVTADTASLKLSCTIMNAAHDQTSFNLIYSKTPLMTSKGGTENEKCSGMLHDGTGSCTITFIQNATNSKLGIVTGNLLPSHQQVGPVMPNTAP